LVAWAPELRILLAFNGSQFELEDAPTIARFPPGIDKMENAVV